MDEPENEAKSPKQLSESLLQPEQWPEFLETNFPGFPEMYDAINDVLVNHEDTSRIMMSMTAFLGNDEKAIMLLKAVYTLGLYNAERGLHATKH